VHSVNTVVACERVLELWFSLTSQNVSWCARAARTVRVIAAHEFYVCRVFCISSMYRAMEEEHWRCDKVEGAHRLSTQKIHEEVRRGVWLYRFLCSRGFVYSGGTYEHNMTTSWDSGVVSQPRLLELAVTSHVELRCGSTTRRLRCVFILNTCDRIVWLDLWTCLWCAFSGTSREHEPVYKIASWYFYFRT